MPRASQNYDRYGYLTMRIHHTCVAFLLAFYFGVILYGQQSERELVDVVTKYGGADKSSAAIEACLQYEGQLSGASAKTIATQSQQHLGDINVSIAHLLMRSGHKDIASEYVADIIAKHDKNPNRYPIAFNAMLFSGAFPDDQKLKSILTSFWNEFDAADEQNTTALLSINPDVFVHIALERSMLARDIGDQLANAMAPDNNLLKSTVLRWVYGKEDLQKILGDNSIEPLISLIKEGNKERSLLAANVLSNITHAKASIGEWPKWHSDNEQYSIHNAAVAAAKDKDRSADRRRFAYWQLLHTGKHLAEDFEILKAIALDQHDNEKSRMDAIQRIGFARWIAESGDDLSKDYVNVSLKLTADRNPEINRTAVILFTTASPALLNQKATIDRMMAIASDKSFSELTRSLALFSIRNFGDKATLTKASIDLLTDMLAAPDDQKEQPINIAIMVLQAITGANHDRDLDAWKKEVQKL